MKILSIESSCDDTSAAVLAEGQIKSNVISSQDFHGKFGGIIPELASRAHLKAISPIVALALKDANTKMDDIEVLAVTSNPGLVGSLIVGSNFAKGLAVKYKLPIVPINHIEGHLYSGCLQDNSLEFPFISLVVSGGHTNIFLVESYIKYEIIGSTRDDAAGEAFDKIAKLMGLTYPGGPLIDKLAKEGNPKAFDFPRPMIHEKHYDFSFSGLKTSVRYFVHKTFPEGIPEEKAAGDRGTSRPGKIRPEDTFDGVRQEENTVSQNHGVIRDNDKRENGEPPADKPIASGNLRESAGRRLLRPVPDGKLHNQQGNPHNQHGDKIRDQKRAAAVGVEFVRESPEIPQPDR